MILADNMKRRLFAPSSVRTRIQLLIALALFAALAGCYPIRSKDAAIGTFELTEKAGTIRLEIAPLGTFTETIKMATGQTEKLQGSWTWADGRISFEGLWIPKEFAPDYILEADKAAPAGTFRYTEPGHWAITTEQNWGTTVLGVFPDSNIEFRKVASQ